MEIELVGNIKIMRGRGRGRSRASRGRRGGISRGRAKKNVKVIESDEEEIQPEQPLSETQDESFNASKIDLEADISQLEPPTFTTLNRGPPEPMLHLRWDHKVSLIGEKVLNPLIHCCDQCLKPILIYARMIPCKHVFCVGCARREEKTCPRCLDPVNRVEQTNLGTVFMCTHGGTRNGSTGCRRTYLSQRDLQAHINHRHSQEGGASPKTPGVSVPPPQQPRKIQTNPSQSDPRGDLVSQQYRNQSRTNLITVPIQQEPYQQQPPPQQPQTSGYSVNNQQYSSSGYSGTNYYPSPPPPYPPQYTPHQDQSYQWQQPPPTIHQFYR